MFEIRRHSRGIDSSSDEELQRAAGAGSEEALASLYRRHGSLIYRFSLRMCSDQSIAEEVTQEVFLALLRQGESFDPSRAALSTWLCGIARRQVWKHLERRQRDLSIELMALDEEGERFEAESPEDGPADLLTRKEAVAAVRQELDQLPVHLKEVLVLCVFEEMTYEEAALIVAVPVGTIRSRLYRAKRRMKLALAGEAMSGAQEKSR